MNGEWVVVSVGGSLLVPKEGIDIGFLRRFTGTLRDLIEDGYRFFLITGGGHTARNYQRAASALCTVPADDLDWIGIHATRLNAHLLKTILREESSPRIITNPRDDPLPESDEFPVIIGAGWRPGRSTDFDAALLAERLGARRMVNLSNIPYVHAEDPHVHPDAKRWERMTWDELRGVIGEEWSPGLNVPFDPVAAKLCQEKGMEVAILSADDMGNVAKALRGEPFRGTVVKDEKENNY